MGRRGWRAAFVAMVLTIGPAVANAQQDDAQAIAAAQSLVDEASDLMDAKKFVEACPKVEQATKLVPKGIGAKLVLAECYEKVGRLASAQGQYLQAEALARAAGDRRAAEAGKAAAKLKPKLATLMLNVPSAVQNIEGLVLTWDGRELDKGIWATPIPVDVGTHVIEVKAPGWKRWKADVVIEANGRETTHAVPLLEKLPEENPKEVPVIREPESEVRTWRTPLFFTALGVGVVGLGIGVGFTVAASAKNKEAIGVADEIRLDRNQSEPLCPAGSADPRCSDLAALQTRRDTFGTIGIAAFAVGGVAAVGTLVLALTGPSKSAAPKKNAVLVMPTPGGVSVSGTF